MSYAVGGKFDDETLAIIMFIYLIYFISLILL